MSSDSEKRLPAELEAELGELLGDRLSLSESVRANHGRDESYLPPVAPWAVVFPETTAEVQEIVCACGRYGVPIVPFGAGSSLEGHVLPVAGGITVSLARKNRVLDVSSGDLTAVVEAGVTRLQLERVLAQQGLFFPVDPGADATLGGMVATGASGTATVRYGSMRENVLALEVVLADGTAIRTGTRARKSSAGYDLTRLMVGSEGTLGIVTEIALRVQGVPEAISSAVCAFPDMAAAVGAAVEVIQHGIPVARVELLDGVAMGAVNRHSGLEEAELPTLFFEFQGSPRSVAGDAAEAEAIARARGGRDFRWATDEGERRRLWRARHDAYFASLALRPGARVLSTDVCVPLSRLAETIGATREEAARASFPVPLVGHVGDGNFHLLLVLDPNSPAELEEAKALNRALVERALAAGGTSTGEHGIGLGKREWLEREAGAGLETMRAIKRALDPEGLLNPGKIFRS